MSGPAPPPGFEPHFRKSPLTDPWEPLYSRPTDAAVIIGLWAGAAHVNARGFVHGGLIAALADNAMGLSCAVRLGIEGGPVTVNLNLDYLGTAQQGQWLTVETEYMKTGGTLSFAQAFVRAGGTECARANATFRVVAKRPATV